MIHIQIDSPELEGRLQQEAIRHSVTVAECVLQILREHLLVAEEPTPENATPEERLPFYATVSKEERLKRFHNWIKSHPYRNPLPPEAFERAGFYEEEPSHFSLNESYRFQSCSRLLHDWNFSFVGASMRRRFFA